MNWKQTKVCVTGAGGFIGSHLCSDLVRKGASVKAILRYSSRSDWGNLEFLPDQERRELQVIRGNVEDHNFIDREVAGQDLVFHLAALIGIPYSYAAPSSYVRTNIDGTVNILEAVRKFEVGKMVHTSTSETYGTARYTPIDEEHPLQGQSPYSASKISADKMAESYHRSFAVPVVTVRPFNTYGPRQSARAVIPTIIAQALRRDEIRLGDLRPVRDLTFVEDTVRGFISAAEADAGVGQVINIGSGSGVSIKQLADLILEIMGCDKPVTVDEERLRPPESEVFELVCNNTRALEMIGWQPQILLRDGLKQTIDFVRQNPSFYKPEYYTV